MDFKRIKYSNCQLIQGCWRERSKRLSFWKWLQRRFLIQKSFFFSVEYPSRKTSCEFKRCDREPSRIPVQHYFYALYVHNFKGVLFPLHVLPLLLYLAFQMSLKRDEVSLLVLAAYYKAFDTVRKFQYCCVKRRCISWVFQESSWCD